MTPEQRKELADKVEWMTPDSGLGFGICAVASSMMWAMDRPSPTRPDYKSTVFVQGPIENYTDEELQLTIDFAAYDRLFSVRRGCNAILFGKHVEEWYGGRLTVRWLCKRLSWVQGSYYADNLPEAMGRFDSDLGMRDGMIGKHVLLDGTGHPPSGDTKGEQMIAEVTGRYPGKFEEPDYFELVARTDDGREVAFYSRRAIIVAETRAKLDRLIVMRAEQKAAKAAQAATLVV